MSRYLLGLSPLVMLLAPSAVFAQNVIHDHTPSTTWSTSGPGEYLPNVEDTSGNTAEIYVPISGFRGDGNNLHSYEIYLFQRDGQFAGPTNWSNSVFTLRFWHDQSSMLSDPLLENPGLLDRRLVFDEPDNADWNTPFSIASTGHHDYYLYRMVFNLESFGIGTDDGGLHFIQAGPSGPLYPFGPGIIVTPAAMGGPGDIGVEHTWLWGLGDPFPVELPHGGIPYGYQMDRLLTVPEPASLLLGLGGLLGLSRRRRA